MTLRNDLSLLAPLLIALVAACSAPTTTPSSSSKNDDNTAGAKGKDDDDEKSGSTKKTPDGEKPPIESGDDIGFENFLSPSVIFTGFTGGEQVFKVPV